MPACCLESRTAPKAREGGWDHHPSEMNMAVGISPIFRRTQLSYQNDIHDCTGYIIVYYNHISH